MAMAGINGGPVSEQAYRVVAGARMDRVDSVVQINAVASETADKCRTRLANPDRVVAAAEQDPCLHVVEYSDQIVAGTGIDRDDIRRGKERVVAVEGIPADGAPRTETDGDTVIRVRSVRNGVYHGEPRSIEPTTHLTL